MLIQKSTELKIDLYVKGEWKSRTAFHNVCEYGLTNIAEMLILDFEFLAKKWP